MTRKAFLRKTALGMALALVIGSLSMPMTARATEGTDPAPAVEETVPGTEEGSGSDTAEYNNVGPVITENLNNSYEYLLTENFNFGTSTASNEDVIEIDANGTGTLHYKWQYKRDFTADPWADFGEDDPRLKAALPVRYRNIRVRCIVTDDYDEVVSYEAQISLYNIVLTYNGNGGTMRFDEEDEYPKDIIKLHYWDKGVFYPNVIVTRNGYTFTGWYDAAEGGNEIVLESAFDKDLTVYAHWVMDGEQLPLKVTTEPREYYLFKKDSNTKNPDYNGQTLSFSAIGDDPQYQWYYRKYNSDNWTEINGATTATPSINMSMMYANTFFRCAITDKNHSEPVYTREISIGVYQYQITYKANGGYFVGLGIEEGNKHLEEVTAPYVNNIDLNIGKTFNLTNEGYTFAGWYTKNTGGEKVTESTTVTKNTTIYAHWTAGVSGTFAIEKDLEGYDFRLYKAGSSASKKDDNGYSLSVTAVGVSPKYQWQIADAGSDEFTDIKGQTKNTASFTVTKDHQDKKVRCKVTDESSDEPLYSKVVSLRVWLWNVNFDGNGGTFEDLSPKGPVFKDIYINMVDISVGERFGLKREGYTFTGWYTQKTGGEEVTKDTPVTKNTTFYAHWQNDEPTKVSFTSEPATYFHTGDTIALEVTVTGTPANKLKWEYSLDDKKTFKSYGTAAKATLTTNKNFVRKTLWIRCTATNADGDTDSVMTSLVWESRGNSTVTIDAVQDEYATNDKITLTAETDCTGKATYQWYYNSEGTAFAGGTDPSAITSDENWKLLKGNKNKLSVKMTRDINTHSKSETGYEEYSGASFVCIITNDEGTQTVSASTHPTWKPLEVKGQKIEDDNGGETVYLISDEFTFATGNTLKFKATTTSLEEVPAKNVKYDWTVTTEAGTVKSIGKKKQLTLKFTNSNAEMYKNSKIKCRISTVDDAADTQEITANWTAATVDPFSVVVKKPEGVTGDNVTYVTGQEIVLEANVTGSWNPGKEKYRWEYLSADKDPETNPDWQPYKGGTKRTLSLKKLTKKESGMKFRCVSYLEEATSSDNYITITHEKAAIRGVTLKIVDSENKEVTWAESDDTELRFSTEDPVTLTVTDVDAEIKKGLSYKWCYSYGGSGNVQIIKTTKASVKVKLPAECDGSNIYCIVETDEDEWNTYEGGESGQNAYKLKGKLIPTAIIISKQPEGDFDYPKTIKKVVLKVTASSKKKPISYQWMVKYGWRNEWTELNANTATLTINEWIAEYANAQFKCVLTNGQGDYSVETTPVTAKFEGYDAPYVKKEVGDTELVTELMNSTSVKLTRLTSGADEVVLPDTVTEDDDAKILAMIATNAFMGYEGSVIEIPDTVTKIAKNAFAGTSGIETVKLAVKNPSKLMIAKNAFADLADGTTVEITASDRNQFKRVVKKIEESGAKNLVFKFVEAE